MSLSILIPYRSDGAHRDRLFDHIMRHYHLFFPEAQICIGEDNSELFNRGRARNAAFKGATGDWLLIVDADTLCAPDAIRQGLQYLENDPDHWVLPYDKHGYYNLSQEYTEALLGQEPTLWPARTELRYEHELESWAGCLIMSRAAFEEVGGYDEGFIGWGYEDNSFAMSMDTLWGLMVRVPDSYCLHLWHEAPESVRFEQPNIAHNQQRHLHYKLAYGNVAAMRFLKKGHI